ncbi:DUF4428 domain-containing protein [Clostridium perfringens]
MIFKRNKCDICGKKAGMLRQKYKDGCLCFDCHSTYCKTNRGSKSIDEITIEEVKLVMNEINRRLGEWDSDIDMFSKNYSNTFYVDETNDRMIVKGIKHKFNIADIIKFELVEQGTSSEVKELYVQIFTADELQNYIKIRVVKAPLNTTYKKTEWTYRPHLKTSQKLIADLESIKFSYDIRQEKYNKTTNESEIKNISKDKFCTECGTPIATGSKFCGECGKKL